MGKLVIIGIFMIIASFHFEHSSSDELLETE